VGWPSVQALACKAS